MAEPQTPRQLPLFPEMSPSARPPRLAAFVPSLSADSSLAVGLQAFDEHLALDGKTENTRRGFVSDLRLLVRRLGPRRKLNDVTTADLRHFLLWMLQSSGRPCSDKTYARRVTTLKVFYAWLVKSGVLTHDPASGLAHRPARSPLPAVLGDHQVAALLGVAARREAEAADPRPALLVRLLLDTGLKKGELSRLTIQDMAWDTDPPTLLVRYDQSRWKSKERRVEYSPAVRRLLSAYRRRYEPRERLFDCTARNLEYVLADLARSAGLPEHTCFETLRWTSALRAFRAGLDHERLREKLGLSPVTWAETRRRLELLKDAVCEERVSEYFPDP